MPEVARTTVKDVSDGILDNMHPRLDSEARGPGRGPGREPGAEVILEPDDILESKGNFLNVGADGNPEGFTLGQLPKVAAHDAFVGNLPAKTTRQNTVPIPVHETGLLMNGPLASGDPEPEQLLVASLPKPERPTIRKRPASVAGYPVSTLASPFWMAFSYFRNGKHTPLSQPTLLPPLGQGQSFKVKLPDSIPLGATHIGVWLSQPGTSTASTPGQMRLQKILEFSKYPGLVEFTGPYVYSTEVPGDTSLATPGRVNVVFNNTRSPAKVGTYRFTVTASNELGETLPGPTSSNSLVLANPYYGEDNPAGYGFFTITRPTLPSGSWGWYLYAWLDGQWHRVFNAMTGEGLSKPFPPALSSVTTGGWSGSEFYGSTDTYLFGSGEPPTENTSGLETPDSPPEEPTPFGTTRPAPGRYYARQRDISEDGDLSPLSDPAEVNLEEDEVMEIVFSNPVNRLPNATLVEKGADGLPLGYTVTGEGVTHEDGELIMNGADDAEVSTDLIAIDNTQEWSAGGVLRVEEPHTGVLSGSFEVVLREFVGSSGSADTVLQTVSAVGEYRYYSSVTPPGYPGLNWQADTTGAQIVYRFASGSNMIVSISRQLLKDYAYNFRRREESRASGGPANSNPSPETTLNPSGGVAVEPAPTPETAPETLPTVGPDRPTSQGEVLDSQDFSVAVGAPWTQDASNATLSISAGKLVCQKSSTGTGHAYITDTFDPNPGLDERHDLAVTANGLTIPTLPTNGAITLLELARPADGESYAWLNLDTRYEEARLQIKKLPSASGDISTTLDEGGTPITRSVPVVATKETATLKIDTPPSVNGAVSVTVGGVTRGVEVSVDTTPLPEVVTVEITRGASATGVCAVLLGDPMGHGTDHSILSAVIFSGDTPEQIANKLRRSVSASRWQNAPWLVSGQGATVVFTAKYGGRTYGEHEFQEDYIVDSDNYFPTHARARVTVTQSGSAQRLADTVYSVAARLSTLDIPGYEVSATSDTVTFEALEAGSEFDASYSDGGTGCSGTMTIEEGARDTRQEIAQKIVDAYAGNSYHAVTKADTIVTFSALSAGAKQDATFSAGSTGMKATMQTTIQGSIDIVAYAKDQFGALRQRRIIPNVTTSTVLNLGLGSSGAGYLHPDSPQDSPDAVIQVWASTGTDEKTLRALFEGVDLGGYPAGLVKAGVTSETSYSSTWEVRIDELVVTDRGETYYRYHDYYGNILNQVHGFFPPTLISSDGLYLQGLRVACLPNKEYTASVFARWAGISEDTDPFYLYGMTPDNERIPIGDLAGYVFGTQEWRETAPLTFTTPEDCTELRLESVSMSAGEIVCQELCISPGSEVKRTPLYAVEGTYTATLSIDTPNRPDYLRFDRERRVLQTDIDIPENTVAEVSYQSADLEAGPYGPQYSDPLDVEQKNFLRVTVIANGDGTNTPVVRGGSPNAEYVLLAFGEPLATFLKEDRTELDGGADFAELDRHAEPPEVVFQKLPGSRYRRTAVYPPVGNLPPHEVQIFTPEAKKFIEDRIGMVDFVVEAWGKILTVRHSGPVRFEKKIREQRKDGRYYGWWTAKLPEAEVVSIQDLPF